MILRMWAAATLLLLGAYYVLRAAAQSCAGSACDVYIPLSLLFPASILLCAAVTGILALLASRHEHEWFSALAIVVSVGIFGPLVALGIFRDRPDTLVPLAYLGFAMVPAAALAHSFARR